DAILLTILAKSSLPPRVVRSAGTSGESHVSPITSLYQIVRRPLLTLAVATTCAAVAGSALAADPGRIDTRSALAERVLFDAGQPGESFAGFIVYYRDDAPVGEEKSAAASRTPKAIDADL